MINSYYESIRSVNENVRTYFQWLAAASCMACEVERYQRVSDAIARIVQPA